LKHNPKIISIGFAVPPVSFTQREIFDQLGYPHHFWRIYEEAAIDKRHFWVPFSQPLTWQEATDAYREGATQLTREVVKQCLDGRDPADIAHVTYASCTGYECPSIAHRIGKGFSPRVGYTPILGTGCEGSAPALRRAYDFTVATGKTSIAISCEICSVCHFPEDGANPDPTREFELLRANAIFGDGACAVLIGYDNNPRHPYLMDFENYFDPENMKHLGFLWQDGRLRCLLSRQVPKIAPKVSAKALAPLLERNGLKIDDVTWWIIHPGGRAVLDNIRDELELPESKMTHSREVLRNYGNCSSSSIGIAGKLLMGENVKPGDWGVIISLGAGLAAGATLLKWETRQ
jgi:predicted naringenin-chalcone synthase